MKSYRHDELQIGWHVFIDEIHCKSDLMAWRLGRMCLQKDRNVRSAIFVNRSRVDQYFDWDVVKNFRKQSAISFRNAA